MGFKFGDKVRWIGCEKEKALIVGILKEYSIIEFERGLRYRKQDRHQYQLLVSNKEIKKGWKN